MAIPIFGESVLRTQNSAYNSSYALIFNSTDISMREIGLSMDKPLKLDPEDIMKYFQQRFSPTQSSTMKAALSIVDMAMHVTSLTESALFNINYLLEEIKNYIYVSTNKNVSDDDKAALAENAYKLTEEIQSVTDQTVFNGTQLLQGSFSTSWVIGYQTTKKNLLQIDFDLTSDNASKLIGSNDFNLNPFQSMIFNNVKIDKEIEEKTIISESLNAVLPDDSKDSTTDAQSAQANDNTAVQSNINTITANNSTGTKDNGTTKTAGSVSNNNFAGVPGLDLSFLSTINNNSSFFTPENVKTTLQSISTALSNVNTIATYVGGVKDKIKSSQEALFVAQNPVINQPTSRIETSASAKIQLDFVKSTMLKNSDLISFTQANQKPLSLLRLF